MLGVTPNATDADVRAAFRRKVIQHHPDTAVQGTDESIVRQLIDAYHVLIDAAPHANSDDGTLRDGESASGAARIHIRRDPTITSRPASNRAQPWCGECLATGLRIRVFTCPACRGSSVLTTLDIGRALVSRCLQCHGRGRVRSVELCPACDGSRIDGS